MEILLAHHHPSSILSSTAPLVDSTPPSSDAHPDRYLVILNSPIPSIELLDRLWNSCATRICADGGANQLYRLFEREGKADVRVRYIPNHIHGDLDSLEPLPRTYYTQHGTTVTRNPEQTSTDLGKAVELARRLNREKRCPSSSSRLPRLSPSHTPPIEMVVLTSLGGRVDHGLGTLSDVARVGMGREGRRVWIVTEGSVSFFLGAGVRHVLHFPRGVLQGLGIGVEGTGPVESGSRWEDGRGVREDGDEDEGALDDEEKMAGGEGDREASAVELTPVFTKTVGILPILGPAEISTRGLKWDVESWKTEMGGNVSTSNALESEEVVVDVASRGVLFTIETSF